MKHYPLVSVLMPVYNGEKYLKEAIDSILCQTYENLELIICNDASTDQSKQIISTYSDSRICYLENDRNMGIVYTRNRLLDYARGEYSAIMDADDIALPEKIEKQVDFMETHPQYALCGTWAKKVNDEKLCLGNIQMPISNQYIHINLLFQSSFVHSTVFMRRSFLGDERYDENYYVAEDYDLWVRCAEKGFLFYNFPEYLLLYRWHATNISQDKKCQMETMRTQIIYRQWKGKVNFSDDEFAAHCQIGALRPAVGNFDTLIKFATRLYRRLLDSSAISPILGSKADVHAFIWYRCFFYCFYFKKYRRACFPQHIFTLKPIVLFRLSRLLHIKFKGLIK